MTKNHSWVMGLGKLGKFPFTDGRGQSGSFLFCVITWPLLKKTLAEKSLMKQTNKTIPVSLEKLYFRSHYILAELWVPVG